MAEDSENENIASFVRKRAANRLSSKDMIAIGDVARVDYKGIDININDLMQHMHNGHDLNKPLIDIIKRRAAYQHYLSNRERKKKEQAKKPDGISAPKIPQPEPGLKS
jgi:hypothetical protein